MQAEREYAADHPQVLRTKARYAAALYDDDELEESAALLDEALVGLEQAFGPDHLELAAIRLNLGPCSRRWGTWRAPSPCCRRALASHEELLPRHDPSLATMREKVLWTTIRLGDREGMLSLSRRQADAIEGRLSLLAAGSPRTAAAVAAAAHSHIDDGPLRGPRRAPLRPGPGAPGARLRPDRAGTQRPCPSRHGPSRSWTRRRTGS